MRNIPRWICSLAMLLCLAACSYMRQPKQQPVVLHYQHVANVHQVRFSAPLQLPPHLAAYVMPRNSQGFWAIFVLCSVDVTATDVPSFVYDVTNFRVDYDGKQYGLLSPYSLRYENSYHLNSPVETPVIADAIVAELHEGPPLQVFAHGFYPSLNYRFALFVPKGLADYAGEPLKLRYQGQPSLVLGNAYPPYDIPVAGGSGAGLAASCRP